MKKPFKQRRMPEGTGTYTIHIDGNWTLEDLYVFPRAYEQVYFVLEALTPVESDEVDERIAHAFRAFPWQGGYSAVGFYNLLKYATPARKRPAMVSMEYASPGWLELGLVVPLAFTVAHVVNRIAKTIENCNRTYSQIYSDAQKRELLKIEIERKRIELTREQIDFCYDSSERLARMMDLPSIDLIHERTKDPLISMKILLSVYRRARTLATYSVKGKAEFNNSRTSEDDDLIG